MLKKLSREKITNNDTIVELSIIRRVHPSIYKSNFLTIIPPQTAPIIAAGTITPPIKILDFELEI